MSCLSATFVKTSPTASFVRTSPSAVFSRQNSYAASFSRVCDVVSGGGSATPIGLLLGLTRTP